MPEHVIAPASRLDSSPERVLVPADQACAFTELREAGARMIGETRGERLVDLARNVIDIIGRNPYERSCDVRWWATDAARVAVSYRRRTSGR